MLIRGFSRLMLGFIIATCFLSMWISNTACTMMMVPIVTAVIKELDTCRRRQSDFTYFLFERDSIRSFLTFFRSDPEQACRFPAPIETVGQNSEEIVDLDEVPEDQLRVYKGLLLCICKCFFGSIIALRCQFLPRF